MSLLAVKNFYQCIFIYTIQKNISVSVVFKAESEPKHKEIIFLSFSAKTKNVHFKDKKIVLKTQISKERQTACFNILLYLCMTNKSCKYDFFAPNTLFCAIGWPERSPLPLPNPKLGCVPKFRLEAKLKRNIAKLFFAKQRN